MFVWCLENPQRALGCGQQVAAILGVSWNQEASVTRLNMVAEHS